MPLAPATNFRESASIPGGVWLGDEVIQPSSFEAAGAGGQQPWVRPINTAVFTIHLSTSLGKSRFWISHLIFHMRDQTPKRSPQLPALSLVHLGLAQQLAAERHEFFKPHTLSQPCWRVLHSMYAGPPLGS